MQGEIIMGLIFVGALILSYNLFFNRKLINKERQRDSQKHQLIKEHFNIEEKDYLLREDRRVVNQYTLYLEGKQYHVQFKRSNEFISIKKLVHVPLNTKLK